MIAFSHSSLRTKNLFKQYRSGTEQIYSNIKFNQLEEYNIIIIIFFLSDFLEDSEKLKFFSYQIMYLYFVTLNIEIKDKIISSLYLMSKK